MIEDVMIVFFFFQRDDDDETTMKEKGRKKRKEKKKEDYAMPYFSAMPVRRLKAMISASSSLRLASPMRLVQ